MCFVKSTKTLQGLTAGQYRQRGKLYSPRTGVRKDLKPDFTKVLYASEIDVKKSIVLLSRDQNGTKIYWWH